MPIVKSVLINNVLTTVTFLRNILYMLIKDFLYTAMIDWYAI